LDFHSLFPLKENNRWIYQTEKGNISIQVTERQTVGPKNFFILETRVDEELIQREKYLVDLDAYWLISRTFGNKSLLYDPPNPILLAPAEVGKSWNWKGVVGEQNLELHFSFSDMGVIRVPAGTFHTIKLEIREEGKGKSLTHRWYSPGIGIVQETAISDLMYYEAKLESYKI
jgi:hypothetical protein